MQSQSSLISYHLATILPLVHHAALIFFFALCFTSVLHVLHPRHDTYGTFHLVPPHANRFDTPWRYPHPLHLSTLPASRYRLLYSPPRYTSPHHLGRHFEAVLSDIAAAHRLSAAYAHHPAPFPHPFSRDSRAIDNLFAWAHGHIRSDFIARSVCLRNHSTPRYCPPCHYVRLPNPLALSQAVPVPPMLTHLWTTPHPIHTTNNAVRTFLEGPAGNSHTLLVTSASKSHCPLSSPRGMVQTLAAGYVFSRYWKAHGDISPSKYVPRRPTPFSQEREFVVAIHIRQALRFRRRHIRTSIRGYGIALSRVLGIVRAHGGPFALMSVAVHFFSDVSVNGTRNLFQDIDGTLLTRHDLEELLLPDPSLSSQGFRVVMRVASSIVSSVHEMVSADLFIGCPTRMSTMVVQTLSRAAVVLLPIRRCETERINGGRNTNNRAYFESETGELVYDVGVRGLWRLFAFYNGFSAKRALDEAIGNNHEDDEKNSSNESSGLQTMSFMKKFAEDTLKGMVVSMIKMKTGVTTMFEARNMSVSSMSKYGMKDEDTDLTGKKIVPITRPSATSSPSFVEGLGSLEVSDKVGIRTRWRRTKGEDIAEQTKLPYRSPLSTERWPRTGRNAGHESRQETSHLGHGVNAVQLPRNQEGSEMTIKQYGHGKYSDEQKLLSIMEDDDSGFDDEQDYKIGKDQVVTGRSATRWYASLMLRKRVSDGADSARGRK